MPSFTLLGEQVIRFPFILDSSYPHELLHNWWGNGVFVDLASGNWCGLTAYLADHLIAEQRGQGADHRRAILQRVTNYVTPENDFPLSRFVSRHNAVTEAVGYGRTAMVFNMLREKLGDAQFVQGLQGFYRDNRFREASFDDIRKSFETVSGLDLRGFFDQWVKGVGTPELKLDRAAGRGEHVDITLSQVQGGRLFALDVPFVIATDKGVETFEPGLDAGRPGAHRRRFRSQRDRAARRDRSAVSGLSPAEPVRNPALPVEGVRRQEGADRDERGRRPHLCGSRQGLEPGRRRGRHRQRARCPAGQSRRVGIRRREQVHAGRRGSP